MGWGGGLCFNGGGVWATYRKGIDGIIAKSAPIEIAHKGNIIRGGVKYQLETHAKCRARERRGVFVQRDAREKEREKNVSSKKLKDNAQLFWSLFIHSHFFSGTKLRPVNSQPDRQVMQSSERIVSQWWTWVFSFFPTFLLLNLYLYLYLLLHHLIIHPYFIILCNEWINSWISHILFFWDLVFFKLPPII